MAYEPRPRGRTAFVVAAALVAICVPVAGCSSPSEAVPPRAVALRPEPEVPPIERLGRWNGTTFVPVPPGAVAGGDLYVLVHGWAPGYVDAVDHFPGPGPLLAWDPQAVNAQGQRSFLPFFAMAAAIVRADPQATVLGFSWLDDSATSFSPFAARESEAKTDLNGQRLAAALGQVLAPTFAAAGGRIHLIGHSHGAKVVTVAALALDRPPEQVTLLDSPEDILARLPGAANHLEGYLPLLSIGSGPGRTFVDSYFSIAGDRYNTFPGLESVVDVQLYPDQYGLFSFDDLVARHGYPVSWYTASARDLAADVGFAWSPLIGTPPGCVQCFFRQDWSRPGGGIERAHQLRLEQVHTSEPRPTAARRLEVQPLRGPSTSRSPEGVILTAPGRRIWEVQLDRSAGDLAIEFDSRFTAPEPGAVLSVWLDDQQVYATAASWAGATGHHAVVDVSSLDPGTHTMTAALSRPANGGTARVILGDFRVESVPVSAPPGGSISDDAKLALVVLVLLASIAMLGWSIRLRRMERSAARAGETAEG